MTPQQQIEHLERSMNMPGVDAAERQIYADTIARILDRMAQSGIHGFPLENSEKNRYDVRASNATEIKLSPSKISAAPVFDQPVTHEIEQMPAHEADRIVGQTAPSVVRVSNAGSTPTVNIIWPDKSGVYNYASAKARLGNRISELSDSKPARENRFNDLTRKATFARAVGYYLGCCALQGRTLSAHDLGFKWRSADSTQAKIFSLIQNAANEAQSKT